MKKIYTLLITLMLLFIPNVYGEDLKYFELRLYEKNTIGDISDNEYMVIDYLDYKGELIEGSHAETMEGLSVLPYTDKNGNLLFYMEYPFFNENSKIIINENSTIERINSVFSEEEKADLQDTFLKGYDGVSLLLFEPEVTNCTSVCIQKISLKDISEGAIIKKRATFEGLSLDLDVQFSEVNDYATYNVKIYNPTDKDYEISTGEDFTTSQYLKYEYKFEDGNNVLKSGETKILEVTVKYNKEVPDELLDAGLFKEDNQAVIKMSNGVEPTPTPTVTPTATPTITPVPEEKPTEVEVPDTYTGLSIFVVIAIIAIAGYISYNKLSSKSLLLLIIPILLIPIMVNAYEKLEVKVETHVEIKKPLKIIQKRLNYSDPNYNNSFWFYSNIISSITFENNIRNIEGAIQTFDLSLNNDESVIAALVEDGALYEAYIMADGIIYANINSSNFFGEMKELTEINNLQYFNTSLVKDMSYMFGGCQKLNMNLDVLDTRNAINMGGMFRDYCSGVQNCRIELGKNFDTSKVTNMEGMFYETGKNSDTISIVLKDKFNTSNVTNMVDMFDSTCNRAHSCGIDLGNNFYTDKVTDMSQMFKGAGASSDSFSLNLGNHFNVPESALAVGLFCYTGSHSGYETPNEFDGTVCK